MPLVALLLSQQTEPRKACHCRHPSIPAKHLRGPGPTLGVALEHGLKRLEDPLSGWHFEVGLGLWERLGPWESLVCLLVAPVRRFGKLCALQHLPGPSLALSWDPCCPLHTPSSLPVYKMQIAWDLHNPS